MLGFLSLNEYFVDSLFSKNEIHSAEKRTMIVKDQQQQQQKTFLSSACYLLNNFCFKNGDTLKKKSIDFSFVGFDIFILTPTHLLPTRENQTKCQAVQKKK